MVISQESNSILYGPPRSGKITALGANVIDAMRNCKDVPLPNGNYIRAHMSHDICIIDINDAFCNQVYMISHMCTTFANSLQMSDKRKMFVMRNADRLVKPAQMALRKFMEGDVIYVLTTRHISKIDDSLKSRCTVVRFAGKPQPDIPYFRDTCARIITSDAAVAREQIVDLLTCNMEYPRMFRYLMDAAIAAATDEQMVPLIVDIVADHQHRSVTDYMPIIHVESCVARIKNVLEGNG